MKKKKNWLLKVKRIDIVDRCIMVIMLILMIQIIFDLFTHHTGQSNSIDIVVRTSSASLFGYIISANFIRHSPSTPLPETGFDNNQTSEASPLETSLTSFDSYSMSDPVSISPTESPLTDRSSIPDQSTRPHDLQILFVTFIGLVALVGMLIANDFATLDPSNAGTLSQLRDFVSGCIGFLVGCSTHSIES